MRSSAGLFVAVVLLSGCASTGVQGAVVVDVIDGDSLRLNIGGVEQEVRLLGLNSPEHDECHGPQAALALEALLAGAELEIIGDGSDDIDRFGRLLRYLYADDRLVNLVMIENGHGLAVTAQHEMSDGFRAAAVQAWSSRMGMWAPDACGSDEGSAVAIASIQPNPFGDDATRPNDEFVVIRNNGSADADLAGWVLRDESSSNRYTFDPDTVLGPGGSVTVHSGCGSDSAGDLYWCQGPVWSNGGDSVIVQNVRGNVVDVWFYDST
jgi:micrococcal nuclease